MKRLICLLLCFAMIFALAACKKEPVQEQPKEDVSAETEAPVEEETEAPAVEDAPVASKNTVTYEIPMESIYFDYPAELSYFTQPYTQLLYTSKDALVGICFTFDEYTGALEDVYDYLMPHFLDDAATSSWGNLYEAGYELVSSEKVTVNGIESCKFYVTATDAERWDCHVYGYSFVIDGIACAVIGIVSTEAQEADLIAEYDALVDQIAATVRTTP